MTASDLGMMLDQIVAAGWGDAPVAVRLGEALVLAIEDVHPSKMDPATALLSERAVILEVRL